MEWFFFKATPNVNLQQLSGMILDVQIQSFRAVVPVAQPHMHIEIFIFKKFQGPKYQYLYMKIYLKLPLTLKNKGKEKIWNLSFTNYYFWPPKSTFLAFDESP